MNGGSVSGAKISGLDPRLGRRRFWTARRPGFLAGRSIDGAPAARAALKWQRARAGFRARSQSGASSGWRGRSPWSCGIDAGSAPESAVGLETSPACGGWAASSAGRGPRPRPRPPRRPRRRLMGRRAAGGKFRLDCSSGTSLFRGRMTACRANAKPNPLHFFTKRASAAVWLCRKFFCPMGPISPLQKNPARPNGPK